MRREPSYEAQRAATHAADAAHQNFMNFIAEELGCERDQLSAAMRDTSKKKLHAIKEKYEARKEAA